MPATMAACLADLPPQILSDILSRLPIKCILVCRSVCKTFLNITTSNPYFNSLRSSSTSQILLAQSGDVYEPSPFVYMVHSELDAGFGPFGSDEKVQLKPMFQIPKYPGKYFEKYSLYVGEENNFIMVNSCNGLLCFAGRNLCERSFICNPITREYVTLLEHEVKMSERQLTMGRWFGFSPRENQYKILRTFTTIGGKPQEAGFIQKFSAQVRVVGSSSWRDIEDKPPSKYVIWDSCSAHVNESVYWLCRCQEGSKFIIYFNFETEKFGEVRPPLELGTYWLNIRPYMSIGVLRGHLCLVVNLQHLDIWVMKENGGCKYWTREWSIGKVIHNGNPIEGPIRSLEFISDGKILMMCFYFALVCYDTKTENFQVVEIDGGKSICKSVLFSPNFVPLKEALMTENVMVQNFE